MGGGGLLPNIRIGIGPKYPLSVGLLTSTGTFIYGLWVGYTMQPLGPSKWGGNQSLLYVANGQMGALEP